MNPLVSVAIVTYNSARYIRECLRYVFEQDHSPLEVVIVDDCSRDRTPEICRELAARDARVRFTRHAANKGKTEGLKTGFALTTGPIVMGRRGPMRWAESRR